jgi:hypothetical protein
MAEPLPRYRKAGVLLADVPRIDFSGQRSAAEVSGQMAKSLDRMSKWAFGEAFDRAKEEGLQYGAENPVTRQQLMDAVTAGENPDKLFQKRNTIFGDAARAAQIAALTSEIEMTAQQQMNLLKLGVERGEVDLNTAQKEIQAMLDGYGKSLVNVDPKASLKLRATLATNANAAYLAMSRAYFKQQDDLRKQAVDQWIDITLGEQVRTIIEAGDTVDPTDGRKITVQQRIDATVRNTLLNNLNAIHDPVFARQAMVRYNKIVSDARIDALVKMATNPEFSRDPMTGEWDGYAAVQKAEAGDFGALSSLFKSMSSEEQSKVRLEMQRASNARYTEKKRAEEAIKEKETREVNDLTVEYMSAGPKDAQRILARLREISAQGSGAISGSTINALVKARRGDGEGNDSTMTYAENLIARGGVRSIEELIGRGLRLNAKQIRILTEQLNNDGARRLAATINLIARIPANQFGELTGEQQRRKSKLQDFADVTRQRLIDEDRAKGGPGLFTFDTVIAEVKAKQEEIIKDEELERMRTRLATYGPGVNENSGDKELELLIRKNDKPDHDKIRDAKDLIRKIRDKSK